jgi:integrase
MPKTEAARRIVTIPEVIVPELRWQLAWFAVDGDHGLLFTSAGGVPLRHINFRNRVWLGAVGRAGLGELHFHDLRHTGNQLAAVAGATLRDAVCLLLWLARLEGLEPPTSCERRHGLAIRERASRGLRGFRSLSG